MGSNRRYDPPFKTEAVRLLVGEAESERLCKEIEQLRQERDILIKAAVSISSSYPH